jgi:plastocyanin
MDRGDARLRRRQFLLGSLGVGLPLLAWPRTALGQSSVEIQISRDTNYGFGWVLNPVGLYIEPGQVVRWRSFKGGATITAYHPDNGNRELRIPEGAKPFHSDILGTYFNETFEWRFDQEGTYDYCSSRQERIGVVGRIIVGRPGGPGERPLGYGTGEGRAPIFQRAKDVFEYVSSERIMKEKRVELPVKLLGSLY